MQRINRKIADTAITGRVKKKAVCWERRIVIIYFAREKTRKRIHVMAAHTGELIPVWVFV